MERSLDEIRAASRTGNLATNGQGPERNRSQQVEGYARNTLVLAPRGCLDSSPQEGGWRSAVLRARIPGTDRVVGWDEDGSSISDEE